jgi:hypothetical protein
MHMPFQDCCAHMQMVEASNAIIAGRRMSLVCIASHCTLLFIWDLLCIWLEWVTRRHSRYHSMFSDGAIMRMVSAYD